MVTPIIRISATAATLCLLVAAASAQANKATSTETSSGQTAPVQPKPQLITDRYLRLFHPEFLVHVANEVKSGRAPKSALDSFAGASLSASLLKADLTPLLGKQPNAVTGPKHHVSLSVLKGVGGPPMGSQNPFFEPQSIEYKYLVPNEEQWPSISFLAGGDGTVSASVTSHADVFVVAGLISYTGVIEPNTPNTVNVQDQVVPGNGALSVKAGQQCSVQVDMLSKTPGVFTTTLRVTGTAASCNWYFDVPLKITVSNSNDYHVNVRVLGSTQQLISGATQFIFPETGKPLEMPLQLTPVNFKQPFDVELDGTDPTGLGWRKQVHIPSNKPVNVTVTVTYDPKKIKYQDYPYGLDNVAVADNGVVTNFYTFMDVLHYHLKISFGNVSNGYNVSGYQPFGSVGSFNMTWEEPGVLLDGSGDFWLQGTVYDGAGYWPMSYWQTGMTHGTPIPFGVYLVDFKGVAWGSYNQTQGHSNWVHDHWDDISGGKYKSQRWFGPGHMRKYFDGNLPPLVNGVFQEPIANGLPAIHKW